MPDKQIVERLWVFDLDGLLMETGMLYDRAIDVLVKIAIKALNGRVSIEEVKKRQNKIDKRMKEEINPRTGKTFGLDKSRFPLSLVRTYKVFCLECGKLPSASAIAMLKLAGKRVFDEKEYAKLVRPEVLPLFKFLKGKGDKIVILTKGDNEVQLAKKDSLCKLGIMNYCDGFVVVPDDKSDAMKKIKKENPASRYYCVGDTYEADVLPGIKISYFGIHIPYALNWMERGRSAEIEAMRDKERSVCFEGIAWIRAGWRLLEKRSKAMRA